MKKFKVLDNQRLCGMQLHLNVGLLHGAAAFRENRVPQESRVTAAAPWCSPTLGCSSDSMLSYDCITFKASAL